MKKILLLALFIVDLNAGDSDTLNTSKDIYNFLSLGIGFATKDINFTQINYDRKLYQNISIYGFLGFPTIYGLGISWKQNYNNNGWVLFSGIGFNPFITGKESDLYYLGILHQWQLWNSHAYLSTGIQISANEDVTVKWSAETESHVNEMDWKIMPYPIVSVDWRLFSDKKKWHDNEGLPKLDIMIILFIGSVILLASMP